MSCFNPAAVQGRLKLKGNKVSLQVIFWNWNWNSVEKAKNSSEGTIILPHSLEAEKAVLGSIFQNQDNLNVIQDKSGLEPGHFFFESHRLIFLSILDLDKKSEPCDLITTIEHLKSSGIDSIGPAYLIELIQSCPVSENIEYYARIVRDTFVKRRLIEKGQEVIQKALTAEGSSQDLLEILEKELLAISAENDRKGEGLISGTEVLQETIGVLEQRILADTLITGVPSGFTDLDHMTGGWQKSDLIILAARPAMGKTALCLNFATNALKVGKNVAIFSLEMSRSQLMERVLASEGRVDSSRLRKGDLGDEDQDRLMHAVRTVNAYGARFYIDETPGLSISELRSRTRRHKKENGLDLIIIDYLQLLSGSSDTKREGREREVSEISMNLKNLAKELSVPIIALAQLNRGPDSRPDKRPKSSDLRESGSLEQDADMILFVYRDEYYNPNSEDVGKAEIIFGKNRHGSQGTVQLAYLPNFVSFHNLMKG